jgi:hypothetical protein
MRAGDLDGGLIAVPSPSRYAMQRQGARSDCLGMLIRNTQPHEDVPPIIDEFGNAGII